MGFPVVGVVGGGQLARMMQPAAVALGVRLRVLADRADDSAAQVVPDTVVGDYRDLDVLRRFVDGVDVLTVEHEHVPTGHLSALEAEGVPVRPGPGALVHAQDKGVMREALSASGVPCPRWALLPGTYDDARAALEAFAGAGEWPVVVKTRRGGYDGKGVWVVGSLADAEDLLRSPALADPGLLVEEKVPFTRELAALVARSPHGQAVAYPVVETLQVDGVCREALAPARIDEEHAVEAQRAALRIAGDLGVTGVLAVELFDTPGGVLVNELAMRPHNSGHWSIDGAVTSQFENHLRAVLDLPLGSPAAKAPTLMVNVLGGAFEEMYSAYRHVMARDPGVKVHLYGKQVRPGRKVGHVNVLRAPGEALEDLYERGRHAAGYLRGDVVA
ncbi:5-(carboxyamino)imidazole ribonucleotide synthase [Vallicoccus soli]|uniref:N5-carboxyaminoimidazole ribonucleotide synthase n=1 Tax=Vallicoccus soli TaxID=2339232 RepID=A0A3A3Z452_9ACTN|nr:5-(carboxyamino)imidazole ribonucleotide synthase [Vallicoccus soli]RJK95327.1 5-(carboxyamino)imidazole ribonucleotide synthase [Vallicoccus soli]